VKFGEVGVLWCSKLSPYVSGVACGCDGRVVIIKIDCGNVKLLCFGVYMTCVDGSVDYSNEVLNICGYIDSCTLDMHT